MQRVFVQKRQKTDAVGRGGALLRPAECTESSEILGKFVCICAFRCRGGRLCPPAGRSIFRADRVVGPYNQVGNCIRICRKFSRERSVFRRAEQSPAPTKIVRIFGGAPKSAAVESAQRKTGNRSFWFSCVYIFSRVMRTQETSTKSSVCSPFATRTACWTAT